MSVEAGDGLAALELIEQTSCPDVVVTDLALPRMDGFELIARIRGDDRLRDDAGDRAQWLFRDGARESRPAMQGRRACVLMKPCLPETLAEELRSIEATIRRKGY